MTAKSPHSTLRLRETLTRHPEIIEEGLQIVDLEFSVFDEPPLDLIGQDADGTLTLIMVRDQAQGTERSEAGGNIIEESVFYWHMVTDFREDFISGIRKLSGRKVKRQPPRIIIIAPSYSDDLIQLAAYVTHIQTLELFTLSVVDDKPVLHKIQLPEESSISDTDKETYESQHGEKITALVEKDKDFFENPKVHAYQPVSIEEHVAKVNESHRESFSNLLDELKTDAHLRVHPETNRISVHSEDGLRVCELVIGPGGGFTIDLFAPDNSASNGVRSTQQFGAENMSELKAALADAKKAFA